MASFKCSYKGIRISISSGEKDRVVYRCGCSDQTKPESDPILNRITVPFRTQSYDPIGGRGKRIKGGRRCKC